nr:unnamed protein product [Callosobruchus analis]
MISYINGLKLGGMPIVKSSRKMGFLGSLICINSFKSLYKTYCLEEQTLKYVLTNKLSQDHLELFFGAIRGKGGSNNNPTARQFEAAYKHLLIHTEVKGPITGNVSINEHLTILCCGSGQSINLDDCGNDITNSKEYLHYEKNSS